MEDDPSGTRSGELERRKELLFCPDRERERPLRRMPDAKNTRRSEPQNTPKNFALEWEALLAVRGFLRELTPQQCGVYYAGNAKSIRVLGM